MLKIRISSQFRKDIKKLSSSGSFNMNDLKEVIRTLENGKVLDPDANRPHKLRSNWDGYYECHIGSISSDWLLIYKIDKKEKVLKLARTGSHSELFG